MKEHQRKRIRPNRPLCGTAPWSVQEKEDGFGRITVLALKGSEAQALLTKRAKKLSLTVDLLEKRAFIDKIRALWMRSTGLKYADALEQVESEEEKTEEEAAQAVEKTAKCLASYTEMLQLAKETLRSKFAISHVDIKLYANGVKG